MRYRNLMVLIASLLSSACHIGGTAAGYTPATTAEGARMIVFTSAGRLTGELVEVKDNGIVLALSDGRVALVPWSVTTSASAEGVPKMRTYYAENGPGEEARSNLVKVSHFPQGMTADIQARFLAAHKQSAVVVIQ